MSRVPPIMILLLNFLTGIPATIVLLISGLSVFGMPRLLLSSAKGPLLLSEQPPAPHFPPIESQAFGIVLIVSYICFVIFGNKWLISDSPYKFEYRLVAFLGFSIGGFIGFATFT